MTCCWTFTPSNTNAYEYYRRPFIRSGLKDCMRLADVMTCSTVPLATALAEFNPNVVVLPNYISSSFLNPRPFSPTPGPVSVGWAGGSSHRADIRLVATALRRAQDANAFGFVSIGHNWTKMLDLADSTYLGWTSRVSDYVASLNFDIGIAPLVTNHFNGCKSPIKAMEYGARAIPVVASNVEPYASYVVHGETGFLANDDDEWVEYLTQLSQDRYLRYRLGMGNYELAKANTLEAHIEARAQAYQRTVAHLPAIRQSKATFNAGVRAKAKLSLPGL